MIKIKVGDCFVRIVTALLKYLLQNFEVIHFIS